MVRYRTEDGRGWYHEPPYTEAEERDFYERFGNGIVGVLKSGHRSPPAQVAAKIPAATAGK